MSNDSSKDDKKKDSAKDDGEGAHMGFMDHLMELRRRLWKSAMAVAICVGIALAFYTEIFDLVRKPLDNVNAEYQAMYDVATAVCKELKVPLQSGEAAVLAVYKGLPEKAVERIQVRHTLRIPPEAPEEKVHAALSKAIADRDQYLDLARRLDKDPGKKFVEIISIDPLGTMLQIMWLGIGAGLVFSSPIILYELWAFIAPGLREKEKNAIKPVLYGGIFFFIGGVLIAYYVLFPVTIGFLTWLNIYMKIPPQYTVEKYVGLLFNMAWITGVLCETPLVVAGLAWMGMVDAAMLIRYWRVAVLCSFVFGSIFSPGTDVMSMLIFAALLLALYVVSIAMAWWFYPRNAAKAKPAAGA